RPTLSCAFFLSGAQTQEARKPPALIPAKSDDAKQTADVTAGFRHGSDLNIVDKGIIPIGGVGRASETELEKEVTAGYPFGRCRCRETERCITSVSLKSRIGAKKRVGTRHPSRAVQES